MNALSNLWIKLTRGKKYREAFVTSQLKRGIPTQIRILRKQRNWKQADLAEASGLTQGAISRAEDPDYGNLTFNNVLKIAAGFDVAFIGRFVPFSELAKWHADLSEDTLRVASFEADFPILEKGSFLSASRYPVVLAPPPERKFSPFEVLNSLWLGQKTQPSFPVDIFNPKGEEREDLQKRILVNAPLIAPQNNNKAGVTKSNESISHPTGQSDCNLSD